MESHATEASPARRPNEDQAAEDRFGFGHNWRRYLSVLTEDRIAEAEDSLKQGLGADAVRGASFLDVGSGSGLFSLAACRLGATRIHSFDYDPESVACTRDVKAQLAGDPTSWTAEVGSILDDEYVSQLGQWDVVYAWGVLHHTGDMWRALDNATRLVAPGGRLFVALYNDQGGRSRAWGLVKRTYNRLPQRARLPYALAIAVPREVMSAMRYLAKGQPLGYVRAWTEYKRSRGMSRWHDIVDWIGGYPFEVAKPEAVFYFAKERGFELCGLTTRGSGLGCNEFVFRRR